MMVCITVASVIMLSEQTVAWKQCTLTGSLWPRSIHSTSVGEEHSHLHPLPCELPLCTPQACFPQHLVFLAPVCVGFH